MLDHVAEFPSPTAAAEVVWGAIYMSDGWQRLSPPATLAVVLTTLSWLQAPSSRPLNCDYECGETLLALDASADVALHGIRYGLLENLGTSENPSLYTHNVNIGQVSYALMQQLGVPDAVKFLLPLLAFTLGLVFVYLFIQLTTGRRLFAYTIQITFGLTYWGISAWSLNALRAWHLPALFITMYFAARLSRESANWRLGGGLLISVLLAFGCGYDFWAITVAVSVLVAVFNRQSFRGLVSLPKIAWFSVAVVAGPLLRLGQVGAVLGWDFVAKDLWYSLAIKIPGGSMVFSIPTVEKIDAYYASRGAYRAPGLPSNDWAQIAQTWLAMLTHVTVPRYGWPVVVAFVTVLCIALLRRFRNTDLGLLSLRALWPLTLGCLAGLVVLAPFSLHVYFKHEFPLVAYPLMMAWGGVFASVLCALRRFAGSGAWRSVALLSLVILTMALVFAQSQWNSYRYGPRLNMGYANWLADHPVPVALDVYTWSWSDSSYDYLSIDNSRATFVPYADVLSGRATPNYFIYQPSDQLVDFHQPYPRCTWTDWASRLMGMGFASVPGTSCIYGTQIGQEALGAREPSLDEFTLLLDGRYSVLQRDDSGIGYAVLERERVTEYPAG